MKTNPLDSFSSMAPNEPFVCSFSGGKDSVLALAIAMERGSARGLIHWTNKITGTSTFHEQSMNIVKLQAMSLKLPLTITSYTPREHRLELLKLYKKFAARGIRSIVFGDIYLEDSVKLQSILCQKAGLVPRYPLWNKSYDDLMREVLHRKIKSIISRINISKLDSKWLGSFFDLTTYQEFLKLPIDPFGERGEFHTTVVDAEIFQQALDYTINCTGGCEIDLSVHDLTDNIFRLI